MAKSQETKERFMELRARGHSYDKISKQLSVSKPTLIKWSRQFGAQIDELKSEEMESMFERFRIARQHRVERFVQQIDRLEAEMSRRDLDDVQTDRLMRLWCRMMEAVREEVEPARIEMTVERGPMEIWEGIIREIAEVLPAAASSPGLPPVS